LILTTTLATFGFLLLSGLPANSVYPIGPLAVALIGFGTAGTMFAGTVGASSGVVDAEQGLAGGLVNMSRQIGAAIGAAVLLAIAESGQKVPGATTSISGDRDALRIAAVLALVAAVVAWHGIDRSADRRRRLRAPSGAVHRTSGFHEARDFVPAARLTSTNGFRDHAGTGRTPPRPVSSGLPATDIPPSTTRTE
jgi:MFS family permease